MEEGEEGDLFDFEGKVVRYRLAKYFSLADSVSERAILVEEEQEEEEEEEEEERDWKEDARKVRGGGRARFKGAGIGGREDFRCSLGRRVEWNRCRMAPERSGRVIRWKGARDRRPSSHTTPWRLSMLVDESKERPRSLSEIQLPIEHRERCKRAIIRDLFKSSSSSSHSLGETHSIYRAQISRIYIYTRSNSSNFSQGSTRRERRNATRGGIRV